MRNIIAAKINWFTVCSLLKTAVTEKCRATIKQLSLYFNFCVSVMLDSLSSSFTSSPLLQYVDTFNMRKSLLLLKSKCNGLIGVWLRHMAMYKAKSASLLLLKSSHSINKTVIDRGVKFSWK